MGSSAGSGEADIASRVLEKARRLVVLKQEYNDLVSALDVEFRDMLRKFSERKVHVHINVARKIHAALSGNRVIVQGALEALCDCEGEEVVSRSGSDSAPLSGSDAEPMELGDISLDVGKFMEQFDQRQIVDFDVPA